MILGWIDWSIIAFYMVITLGLGLYFARRGTANVVEYFVAGRKLTWWLAGTSIVATSFAADTPLAIARIVRTQGFQGNWYWWCGVMGFMLCMFFFAPLWQRSRLMTDVEFIELRYAGRPAAILRLFQALYLSILANGITMGWVILGMQKISVETFGWSKAVAIPLLVGVSFIYTVMSGLWGVVVTDFFQFALAMFGSISLMIFVLADAGGPAALAGKVQAALSSNAGAVLSSPLAPADQVFNFLPNFATGDMALYTFLFFILIQWWGGGQGGGFLAQRLFATANERHAVLALLWFTIAHFVVRTWPWIVVGLASIVYFADLPDPELAYPKMMIKFLPVGMIGIMVASLLAAFMSTITTHLNWGASYLMNDVYRRFIKTAATDRHYVIVSQFFVVAMTVLGGVMAWQMDSIVGAWLYLSEIASGAAVLGVLRWYWWRINAWSEISALATSLILSNTFRLTGFMDGDHLYPARFMIIMGVSTVVWVIVTFATKPVPQEHMVEFYRRVRPGGAWGPIRRLCPDIQGSGIDRLRIWSWALGVVTVYLALFGVGWLCIGRYAGGLLAFTASLGTGAILLKNVNRI
ncbi:MAG: hypothetical protein A3I06_10655, partial [Candidatus Lindowbacteria bacterium RIFCSPLOWO2_02_FULL_62_12]